MRDRLRDAGVIVGMGLILAGMTGAGGAFGESLAAPLFLAAFVFVALRIDDWPIRRWQRWLAAAGVATQALAFVLAFAGGLTLQPDEPLFVVVQSAYVGCLVAGIVALVALMSVALHRGRREEGLLAYFGLREQPRR